MMADLTLYHAAPSRSSIVLWMLEEIGEPYDIHLFSLKSGTHREPDYLAVNPMGKVPALRHRGVVITEVAAICTYLADAFPQAGLNIPLDDPRRGPYLKWLFFGPSVLESAVVDRAYPRVAEPPRSAIGYGDFETAINVVASAVTPGPFLMGDRFTAADVVIGANVRWGMTFKMIPERKEFVDYVARFADRPAARRAQARDEELAKA
ncbi:MAG: glutathione S-transferase [Bradyrhizobiaceae bacterium]|nr:glutathione S-transferase [Bradyrhizobiaceae bacterium]